MKNRAELIATFIIGYLILLSICIFLYFIFANLVDLKFFSEKFDPATIMTNLLMWSATLYAPMIAIFLFSDWKDQHNKLFHSERALELISLLKKLNKDISLINITINYIKDYEKEKAELEEKRLYIYVINKISDPNRDNKENYDPNIDKRLHFVTDAINNYLAKVKDEFNKILELAYEIDQGLGYYISYTEKNSEEITDIIEILEVVDSIHTKFRTEILEQYKYPELILKFEEIQKEYGETQMKVVEITRKIYKVTKA